MLLAGLMGLLGARLVGARSGLFTAGLVLAWAAWGTGTVDQILRRTQSGSILWTISLEGVLFGGLGIAVAWVILLVARDRHGAPAKVTDEGEGPPAAFGFAVAVVAGGIGACLIAQESLKGQCFAAAVVAGLFGALFGRLGSHKAQELWFFAAVALLAAAGPAAATILHSGEGAVVRAAYAGQLLPLARPLPLDWVAGAFVGIPIGLNWAASMTEHHQHAPKA
jgi:hypothetical protein